MRALFWLGLAALVGFELAQVWFIMPLPGSQHGETLDLAYGLHGYRIAARGACAALIVIGAQAAFAGRGKWFAGAGVLVAAGAVAFVNLVMSADSMFKQPAVLAFDSGKEATLDPAAIVVGVTQGGQSKAYPLRYLVYHHQVRDTVGGQPMMVTYCSVCRTGRVFDPRVDGEAQEFRLVGMDHYNAMFEDAATKSWWRQATGRAVEGPRKGMALAELPFEQMSLGAWLALHPDGAVMRADAASLAGYDADGRFERGESKGELTRTDARSWEDKSWVVGISAGGASKAWDWNVLKRERLINDAVGGVPVVIALGADGASFVAFERPAAAEACALEADAIACGGARYDWSGADRADPARRLKAVNASQEFWHSWRTFHPEGHRGGSGS